MSTTTAAHERFIANAVVIAATELLICINADAHSMLHTRWKGSRYTRQGFRARIEMRLVNSTCMQQAALSDDTFLS